MAFRFDSNDDLEAHLEEMRRVNVDFRMPLFDCWDPHTWAALTDLTERKGRLVGVLDGYRLEYYQGRDLPVELDIVDAATGRRLAQDGSRETAVLNALRRRLQE